MSDRDATIREILFAVYEALEEKGYNPLSYRYLCLSSHYRNTLMFDFEILDGAVREYQKLKKKTLSINKEENIDILINNAGFGLFGHFDKTDLYLAESKTEVNIDRITSKANPRTQERVPRGAQFQFEAVLNIFDGDNEAQYDADIRKSIALLEDDYLGGHGSRGYGRIRFINLKTESKNTDNY